MTARARDRLLGASLFLGVVVCLLASEGGQGFGRDEGQYMRAGERYWGWFEEVGRDVHDGHPTRAFSATTIDRFWSDNAPDHPVIMKTLYGLSWRAFHRCTCTGPARGLHPIPVRGRHVSLPLFVRDSTAFRFPAILMAGLLAWLVFRFARQFLAAPAAAAASVLAIAQPHYFFHAPIACFDAPVTTMAFAVGFAYWKSLRSARWGVAAGVVFGLALGVKHNAWLMPFFLAVHYVWMRRGDLRRLRPPRVPLAFVSMALAGPIVFFLHWPWLWHQPIQRTRSYVLRHLEHEHYNFEYLGRNWNLPPTDGDLKLLRATFPFVSTALTVPVTTLGLAAVGGVVLALRRRKKTASDPVVALVDTDLFDPIPEADALLQRVTQTSEAPASLSGDAPAGEPALASAPAAVAAPPLRVSWLCPGADVDRAPGAFIAVQTFGPLAILAIPSTPIFGGVKHFMPAMPYLALSAGVGLAFLTARGVAALRARQWSERRVRALATALAVWVCVPAVVETRRSHPDGLSHYNMLAGGFTGGASLGMNRQFWAYCVLPMLDWVNSHPAEHGRMYWHDVLGDALSMYKREGRLSMSVGDTGFAEPGVERSAMGLLVEEKHWALYEKFIWEHYGHLRPSMVRDREGVPLVLGYERKAPP